MHSLTHSTRLISASSILLTPDHHDSRSHCRFVSGFKRKTCRIRGGWYIRCRRSAKGSVSICPELQVHNHHSTYIHKIGTNFINMISTLQTQLHIRNSELNREHLIVCKFLFKLSLRYPVEGTRAHFSSPKHSMMVYQAVSILVLR